MKSYLPAFLGVMIFAVGLSETWHRFSQSSVDSSENETQEVSLIEPTFTPPEELVLQEQIAESGENETEPHHVAVKMDAEEFHRVSQEIIQDLPTKTLLNDLPPEATHHTPEALRIAGREIGRIQGIIQDNPELKKEGSDFFSQCTEGRELPRTIRALCYAKLEKLDPPKADDLAADLPEQVLELADLL